VSGVDKVSQEDSLNYTTPVTRGTQSAQANQGEPMSTAKENAGKNDALTVEQAIALLPDRERLHTFQRSWGWMGCDVDRTEIEEAIRKGGARMAEADECPFSGHELVVTTYERTTFVDIRAT